MQFSKLALAAALIAAGTTTAFANPTSAATTTEKSDPSAQAQSSMASTNGATADKSVSASTNGSTASSAGDESVRQLQQALKDKGFDPGPIDGIMGPRTQAAIDEAKQAGVTDLPGMSAATSASAPAGQPSSASTNQPASSASTNQPASSASTNQPSATSESASQTKQ